MVSQLVGEMTQLVVPQEVLVFAYMLPRRTGRAIRKIPLVDDEVDVLAVRVDDMELIMARFQRMNPQTFDGDESSSDAESWL
ncbi:hypothetical protein F511_16734 [Dorcoceras hygrometricum]|uniref:Uncharacterized protein n=1 Tax=Dorcoceras hygrometricum TaxID=472368 RepID=A0A2Z7BGE6_9LAMI|nr:hypothetical protein F511_16734 [Dorcoceras hygrometricum]